MKPSDIDKQVVPVLKIAAGALVLWGGYKLLQKVGVFSSADSRRLKKYLAQATEPADEVKANNKMLAFNPDYAKTLFNDYVKKYGSFSPWLQMSSLGRTGRTRKPSTKPTASEQKVINAAKLLHDAKGLFSDDEMQLYTVFKSIDTLYQLSAISRYFKNKYSADLLEYLQSFTNQKELLKVLDLVNKYELYKVVKA